jgi:hypothetical protein
MLSRGRSGENNTKHSISEKDGIPVFAGVLSFLSLNAFVFLHQTGAVSARCALWEFFGHFSM